MILSDFSFFANSTGLKWRNIPGHPLIAFEAMILQNHAKHEHLYELNNGTPVQVAWSLVTTEWLRNHCGWQNKDAQVFVRADPTTLFFQSDFKNKGGGLDEQRGQLDPSILIIMRDVHRLMPEDKRDVFAFLGPHYSWPQYLAALPGDCVQSIFNQPYRDGKLEDFLEIRARRPAKQLNCLIGHGIGPESGNLAYSVHDDCIIRPGMCIEFYNPEAGQGSAEAIDIGSIDAIRHLQGVVMAVGSHDGPVEVQLLLASRNLPPCLQWPSLGRDQVFQTDIRMIVPLDQVNQVVRVLPHQLHQHGNAGDSIVSPKCDVVVVAHLTVTGYEKPGLSDALEILRSMPTCKLVITRIGPLRDEDAFEVLNMTGMLFGVAPGAHSLFGIGNRSRTVYRDYLKTAVKEFALSKALKAQDTRRDNTLHLNLFGPVLMHMIYDELQWESRNSSTRVTIQGGTVIVTIPSFEEARPLLLSDDGVYDLTSYGYGFVQLYAPIAFKWEMYDTGGGKTGASRAPDGFTAITFESYVERDRHNQGMIKGTRSSSEPEMKANARQLRLPPSRCPGFLA